MKNKQQYPECKEVENRTDQAKEYHIVADKLVVPPMRLLHHFRVHIIPSNGCGGDIREEIIQQDLRRGQGQERKQQRCSSHTKHVSEIRTDGSKNILKRIGESHTAFINTLTQNIQILLQ